MSENTRKYNCIKAKGLLPGAYVKDNGVEFTAAFKVKETLQLKLYNKKDELICEINMLDYKVSGNVYSVFVEINEKYIAYELVLDGEVLSDPKEKNHVNKRKYGELKTTENSERSLVYFSDFDWEDDKYPLLPYDEIFAYSLHVRGFTKHSSSKVKSKGTFKGVVEKINYLKELSVNQVILMPSYEFYEFDSEKEKLKPGHPKYATDKSVDSEGKVIENKDVNKLNYWGFKTGHYYCPKAAYAYGADFVNEFKAMVKALHKEGIEVIMQFYFDKDATQNSIVDILHFWRIEYHIDGFQLMGSNIPKKQIVSDDLLSDAKLYFEFFDMNELDGSYQLNNEYSAEIGKAFLTDARRFLKSDDDSLHSFIRAQRHNPKAIHRINYLTCYEGFTLNDLVSYDYKHNEANGEDNRDGTNYNYSWNCGVEGKSKKKSVEALRMKQMKNAFCLLLLSQATPMIFMGDELMNTQNGNNNPYCIDNDTTWVNYGMNKQNTELLNFVKGLIKFRKDHKLLHLKDELKVIDYKSLGFPDISYHQDMAWKSRTDSFIKHIGVMLSGEYADGEDSIYIAYNMHWENHVFGLPKLKKGRKWEYVLDTSGQYTKEEVEKDILENPETLCVYNRSIMVLKAKTV